jgi:hypothetical protein
MVRYIYYIIVILLVLSAIIGYELESRNPVPSPRDAAIIVNAKVISVEEFNKLYSSRSSGAEDRSGFINSLLTKELLIQESKKEGIDKEEPFRRSIQNFYEQSLIKLLMDRKCACLNITVTDDEVNGYIAHLNKKMYLTIFSFDSADEVRKGEYTDGEKKSVNFEDLSADIRNSVIPLEEGELTGPVKTGGKYIVTRLDRMEDIPSRAPSVPERDNIRKMLIEERKEKILNDWIADLRKKASIKVLVGVN